MNTSAIDKLPGELAAALQSDPFFCDIPVVVYEKGNVITEIEKLQAVITSKKGKWGAAVIVLQCVADNPDEVPFGALRIRPAFQVIEQPTQNNSNTGTGKSARLISRKIIAIVSVLFLRGLCSQFKFEEQCIEPVQLDKQNLIGYQVNCHTYENDTEMLEQVGMPVFSSTNNPPMLVLTSPTAGATIFYTLDDSFPDPQTIADSTAEIYSDPIPIPEAGFTIRAAAYVLPGNVPPGAQDVTFIGSPVNRAVVTLVSIT